MKKLTALAVALTMLLSFAACNSEDGGAAEADVTTAAGNATKEIEENTETEEKTVHDEIVEPAAEDFEYKYDATLKGIVIQKYKGEAEIISIPTELDGYPVLQIGERAFYSCSNLKSVTIPDSVTEICEGAFFGCTNLGNVEIPNSVTKIWKAAFCDCESLKSIKIPNGITEIYSGTFELCKGLENIEISNSITKIGSMAFKHCEMLKEITIPDSVKVIDEGAFEKCTSLESVSMPDSVEYIGESVFSDCSGLKEVTLSDGVILDQYVFSRCTDLRNLILPDDVSRTFGSTNIFSVCESLTVTYKGNEYNYTNFKDLYAAMPEKEYTE